MQEQLKIRLAGAGAALATSITAAAWRASHLGPSPFSVQLAGALVTLSWAPFFYFTRTLSGIPLPLGVLLALVWLGVCGGPVSLALLRNLFMGHRVEGSQWYHAAWRVYVITGLWIGLALLNERVVRPWWKENSSRFFGDSRSNSIGARARQMALDRRAKALEAIKLRVRRVLRKKKLAEQNLAQRKERVENAKGEVEKMEKLFGEAKERMEKCEGEEGSVASRELEEVSVKLEGARAQEKQSRDNVLRSEVELDDLALQMEGLQSEWTEALHIQNHTIFCR